MDGNSTDSVGSNNGTDTNITYSAANGKINNGAGFAPASTSRIVIGTGLNATVTSSAWSFSVWVKPADLTSTYAIMGCDTNSGVRQFLFCINSAGLYFERTGTTVPLNTTTGLSSGWNHIVVTYDGTKITGYVNTTQNAQNNMVALPSSTNALNFGRREYPGSNYYWNGAMDEFAFWNKVLTTDEISELYASGAGNQYPFGGTPTPAPSKPLTRQVLRHR